MTEDREADGKRSRSGRFSGDRAREAGARGGRARRKLTLADVEAALPPALDTLERIRLTIELAQRWVAGGLLSGVAGGVLVRGAEAALKLMEAEVTFELVEDLRGSVRSLQAERDELARQVEQLTLQAARPRLVP